MSEQLMTSERTCACRSVDAKECIRIRYPRPIADDIDRDALDWDDERCECVCHEMDEDEYMDWAEEHAMLGRM